LNNGVNTLYRFNPQMPRISSKRKPEASRPASGL